jgi:hypothetical protein
VLWLKETRWQLVWSNWRRNFYFIQDGALVALDSRTHPLCKKKFVIYQGIAKKIIKISRKNRLYSQIDAVAGAAKKE